MPFLSLNQQCQSTEGHKKKLAVYCIALLLVGFILRIALVAAYEKLARALKIAWFSCYLQCMTFKMDKA